MKRSIVQPRGTLTNRKSHRMTREFLEVMKRLRPTEHMENTYVCVKGLMKFLNLHHASADVPRDLDS
jgi:hypothetical protein